MYLIIKADSEYVSSGSLTWHTILIFRFTSLAAIATTNKQDELRCNRSGLCFLIILNAEMKVCGTLIIFLMNNSKDIPETVEPWKGKILFRNINSTGLSLNNSNTGPSKIQWIFAVNFSVFSLSNKNDKLLEAPLLPRSWWMYNIVFCLHAISWKMINSNKMVNKKIIHVPYYKSW